MAQDGGGDWEDGPPVSKWLVHPGRLTWNIQITHLERKMIFQTSMIMFHVNLPGCSPRFFSGHLDPFKKSIWKRSCYISVSLTVTGGSIPNYTLQLGGLSHDL